MLSLLSMVNPAGSSVPLVPATVSGSVVFFFGLLFVRPPPITSYNMPFGISSSSNTNNSSLDDNGISRHRHHRHSRATVATATLARPSDTKMSLGPSSLSSSRKHSLKRQRLPNTSSRGYVYGTSEQVPVAPHCSVTSAEVEEGDSGGGGGGVGASGGGLTLERVKNIRDLGSVEGSGIVKGRVYRTGFLSEATKADADRLMDVTGLKTLVDLRSATELEKDQFIHAEVYRGFENVGNKDSDSNTSKRRAASRYTKDTLQGMWETQPAWSKAMFDEVAEAFSNGDAGDAEPLDGEDGNAEEEGGTSRRRYFVSLIDEGIYKKGVFQRLRGRHKVQEIYSLMKSLAFIIQNSQSPNAITCSPSVQRIIMLIIIHDASHYFAASVAEGKEPPVKTVRIRKAHAELSDTGKETRAKVFEAVFKRFGQKRWGRGYKNESHLIDMVLAFNPGCRSLGYMGKLSDTTSVVDDVKRKVWTQLKGLVEEAIIAERAAGSTVRGPGEDDGIRAQKHLKFTTTWIRTTTWI